MLDVTRIDHIGMVVPELEPQLELFESLFGFRRVRSWSGSAASSGALLAIPGSEVRWEVLVPTEGSPLTEFIEGPRGPGVHHVALEVPDVQGARTQLKALGIEPWDEASSADTVLIHPERGGHGLTFRLATPGAVECCGDAAEAGDESRPSPSLGITGIDHVCHAHPDREELGGWYERVFGMRETHRTPPGEHEDLADLVLDTPGGRMRWEVLQPIGEGSFVQRFLDSRGSAVHHVAFQVGDWDHAVAACEQHGLAFFDESNGVTEGASWRDAFIHPRDTGGLLVQCFWEEHPGVWVASDKVRSDGG